MPQGCCFFFRGWGKYQRLLLTIYQNQGASLALYLNLIMPLRSSHFFSIYDFRTWVPMEKMLLSYSSEIVYFVVFPVPFPALLLALEIRGTPRVPSCWMRGPCLTPNIGQGLVFSITTNLFRPTYQKIAYYKQGFVLSLTTPKLAIVISTHEISHARPIILTSQIWKIW